MRTSNTKMITHFTRKLPSVALAVALAGISSIPVHAISLDLTSASASGTINSAFFSNTDVASTGTGLINSFVRLQATGSEIGYNADARPVMADVNTSPLFTRDLTLGAVPIVVNPT